MEHSPEDLQTDYALWQSNPALSKIRDVQLIANMVILIASSKDGCEYVYTCKNLQPDGNCGIYETRPQMCRDFPGPEGCHFRKCESSQSAYYGMSLPRRFFTRWKWLRGLNRSKL